MSNTYISLSGTLLPSGPTVSNAQGTIKFSNPSAGAPFLVQFDGTDYVNGNGSFATWYGGGWNSGTTAINAVKIYDAHGGTVTGNFHLYGLAGT